MNRDDYVSTIKTVAAKIIKADIIAMCMSAIPALSFPPVYYMLDIFAQKLADYLVGKGETAAFFGYIDLRTNEEGKNFEVAAMAHQKARESGDANDQAKAEKDLLDSFRTLTRLTA